MKKLCQRVVLFLLKNYAYLFGKFGMIVPFPEVKIFKGDSANDQLAKAFSSLQARKTLIITDRIIFDLGLHKNLVESFSRNNIDSCVFAQVEPDPDFSILEQGVRFANEQNIDSIVAIGGGSVMDAAKLINPAVKFNRSPRGMMGLFRVLRKAYPFACIPTTAGTGSEVTVAAVITDKKTETKKFCLSPAILPDFAVLDKNLLRTLPPFMVATSGLDALTHAFEAYMSRVASRETKENSLKAIILILDNLQSAYENPEDLISKENMLLASHYAGLAFTRANVGWVHAIAHQFGGIYHLNHGYANAVILPHIMRFYEKKNLKVYQEINYQLNDRSTSTLREAPSQSLLDRVEQINHALLIPKSFPDLEQVDCLNIAKRAYSEVITMPYPVPAYFSDLNQLTAFIQKNLVFN